PGRGPGLEPGAGPAPRRGPHRLPLYDPVPADGQARRPGHPRPHAGQRPVVGDAVRRLHLRPGPAVRGARPGRPPGRLPPPRHQPAPLREGLGGGGGGLHRVRRAEAPAGRHRGHGGGRRPGRRVGPRHGPRPGHRLRRRGPVPHGLGGVVPRPARAAPRRGVTPLESVRLTLVDSFEEAEEFARWLSQPRPVLGLDTETEGLDWWRDRLRLIQVGDEERGFALPFPNWGGLAVDLLSRYRGPLVLQNAKFDAHHLRQWAGWRIPWERTHDTKVMAHLVDPLGPQGLKQMGAAWVDPRIPVLEDMLKKGMAKNRWTW